MLCVVEAASLWVGVTAKPSSHSTMTELELRQGVLGSTCVLDSGAEGKAGLLQTRAANAALLML